MSKERHQGEQVCGPTVIILIDWIKERIRDRFSERQRQQERAFQRNAFQENAFQKKFGEEPPGTCWEWRNEWRQENPQEEPPEKSQGDWKKERNGSEPEAGEPGESESNVKGSDEKKRDEREWNEKEWDENEPGSRNQSVVRNYKDSLFRMIFSDKRQLLVLYNSLNRSQYTDVDQLEFVTLKNAIYMNIKNDLSFIIDTRLYLYEHQSTYTANMPLRDLFYVADQLQKLVKDDDLYKRRIVRIPAPEFVVFYNGVEEQPESKEFRLSDAYIAPTDDPKLELKVTMLNINRGYNQELMDQCKTLRDYAAYVDKVRVYRKTMSLEEAVRRAVDECIQDDVLREFLLSQKAEAIKMTIYEFDQARHDETLREEGWEEGREEGRKEGREEGRKEGREEGRKEGREEGEKKGEGRMITLIREMTAAGDTEQIPRLAYDADFLAEMYEKYHL